MSGPEEFHIANGNITYTGPLAVVNAAPATPRALATIPLLYLSVAAAIYAAGAITGGWVRSWLALVAEAVARMAA